MTARKAASIARGVARKSAKPRVILDILTALSIALSISSQWSYDLGAIAMIVPPEWKPTLAQIGVISTIVLQVIRPFLPSPNQQPQDSK